MSYTETAIHSHSALNTMEQCPKKYFHIKVAKDVKQSFGPKTPAQQEGDSFHKAVETCLLVDNPVLPPRFDGEQYMATYAHILNLRYKIRDASLDQYVSKPELCLAINNKFESVSYHDRNVPKMFLGRIDYAAYARDIEDAEAGRYDVAVLVDIKTGKSAYSTPQQLERMALLMFCCYPHINKIISGYIWTNEGATFEEHKFSREKDFDRLKKQLQYDIGNISRCETSGNWPAIQSGLCSKWCAVPNSKCEHSGKKG